MRAPLAPTWPMFAAGAPPNALNDGESFERISDPGPVIGPDPNPTPTPTTCRVVPARLTTVEVVDDFPHPVLRGEDSSHGVREGIGQVPM
jgi:hypothetical protein